MRSRAHARGTIGGQPDGRSADILRDVNGDGRELSRYHPASADPTGDRGHEYRDERCAKLSLQAIDKTPGQGRRRTNERLKQGRRPPVAVSLAEMAKHKCRG